MKKSLRIISVSSEVAPYSKSGGLADVCRALPNHLSQMGHFVTMVTPFYGFMKKNPDLENLETIYEDKEGISINGHSYPLRIKRKKEYNFREIIFICNEEFFGGHSKLYGYPNDNLRFLFFNKAALHFLSITDLSPDIIHCHDWQAGALPNLISQITDKYPNLKKTATVFTVHNLAFQMGGTNWWDIPEEKRDDGKNDFPEQEKRIQRANFVKRAVRCADVINTVSERYAQEILTPEFGQGLDKLLLKRQEDVYGIINGIDYSVSNPLFDENIEVNYDWNSLYKKKKNKLSLQKLTGLEQDENIPLIGMTHRLTEQKGFDLIREIMWILVKLPLQLVIVGTGEKEYLDFFRQTAKKHPRRIGVWSPFTQDMESKIYAGSDMFLMPSHYEPCGISQMKSLRYGSIPIVHKTGGLSDTIENFNPKTKRGNGFVFTAYTKEDLLIALTRAIETYQYPKIWTHLAWEAMQLSYSWKLPAKKYVDLYKIAMKKKNI
ncbi:MAG TPA: glycogen/starch synthase [Patescibacteria group bacterium]|nr:glycogen/starch synthase [Patescibacteria group bacterium]